VFLKPVALAKIDVYRDLRNDSKKTFRMGIRDGDWARYDFYASKIVQLGDIPDAGLSPLRTCDTHPSVLLALVAYRPSRFLLPNLRTFRCTDCTIGILPAIQAFIGAPLTHVQVDCRKFSESSIHRLSDLDILFSSISRLSPGIRSVDFQFEGPMLGPPAFFNMLGNLQHLNILNVSKLDIPPLVLNQLANLPSLESLGGISLSPSSVHILNTENGRFTKLKYFTFLSDDVPISSIIAMLDAMRCEFLQVHCDSLETTRNPSQILSLIASLHRHPCRLSLKTLGLRFKCEPAQPVITIDAIRPLFSFSLTSLTIAPIGLDDSSITEIAQAWPDLHTFSARDWATERPKATLEGIAQLVKYCPQLHTLTIPICAQPVRHTLLNGVSNDQITDINVDCATIVEPKKLFRSLVRLFPNLTAVHAREARRLYTREEVTEYRNGWEEINNLLWEIC
jgi:hypothetical protein